MLIPHQINNIYTRRLLEGLSLYHSAFVSINFVSLESSRWRQLTEPEELEGEANLMGDSGVPTRVEKKERR